MFELSEYEQQFLKNREAMYWKEKAEHAIRMAETLRQEVDRLAKELDLQEGYYLDRLQTELPMSGIIIRRGHDPK